MQEGTSQQNQSPSSIAAATIQSFLQDLSSHAPVPGGGAATALVGAMGAALISMVCNLTIGRPRYAAVESAMQQILTQSETARERLLALADADANAYAAVNAAYRLGKATEAERTTRIATIQAALEQAAAPPLAVLRESRSLLPLSLEVAAHGNTNVVSDAAVAAELAAVAVRASVINVRVNLAAATNSAFIAQCEEEIARAESGLQDDLDRTIAIVRGKLAPKAQP